MNDTKMFNIDHWVFELKMLTLVFETCILEVTNQIDILVYLVLIGWFCYKCYIGVLYCETHTCSMTELPTTREQLVDIWDRLGLRVTLYSQGLWNLAEVTAVYVTLVHNLQVYFSAHNILVDSLFQKQKVKLVAQYWTGTVANREEDRLGTLGKADRFVQQCCRFGDKVCVMSKRSTNLQYHSITYAEPRIEDTRLGGYWIATDIVSGLTCIEKLLTLWLTAWILTAVLKTLLFLW